MIYGMNLIHLENLVNPVTHHSKSKPLSSISGVAESFNLG